MKINPFIVWKFQSFIFQCLLLIAPIFIAMGAPFFFVIKCIFPAVICDIDVKKIIRFARKLKIIILSRIDIL